MCYPGSNHLTPYTVPAYLACTRGLRGVVVGVFFANGVDTFAIGGEIFFTSQAGRGESA